MKTLASRIIAMGLSASMVLSMGAVTLADESELSGHWAEDSLNEWLDAGYLKGNQNGDVLPDSEVTRAEFMTMMNRRVGYSEKADISAFSDVASDDWFYDDVAIGVAAGYLTGTGSTTMSPNSPITRQEMAVIMARVCALEDNEDALADYSDASDFADWAAGPAGAVVAAGLLQGDNNRLSPLENATRAQSVVVIERLATSEYLDADAAEEVAVAAVYQDGTYIGTGAGYGGTVKLSVTIVDGKITAIEVISHYETAAYWSRASKIIDTIIATQSTEGIDTVSGATLSCNAILTAVNDALGQALGNESSGKTGSTSSGGGGGAYGRANWQKIDYDDYYLADGTYTGSAPGYCGMLYMTVTVSGGEIYSAKVTNHYETIGYYNDAKSLVDEVAENNATTIDTVSGATYTSWAILGSVEDALDEAIIGEKSAVTLSQLGDVYAEAGVTSVTAVTDSTTLTSYLGYAEEIYGDTLTATDNLIACYDVAQTTSALLLTPIPTYDSNMDFTYYCIDGTAASAVATQVLYLSGTYYAVASVERSGPYLLVLTPQEVDPLDKLSVDLTATGITETTLSLSVPKDTNAKLESDSIFYDYTIDIYVWSYNDGGEEIVVALDFEHDSYYEPDNGGMYTGAKQTVNHEYVEDLVDDLTTYLSNILCGRVTPSSAGLIDAYTGATLSYTALDKLLLANGYSMPTGSIEEILVETDYEIVLTETTIDISVMDSAIVINSSKDLEGAVLKITDNATGVTTREAIDTEGLSYVKLGAYSGSYFAKVILADYAAETTTQAIATDGYLYGTMSIPYADFYAAEGSNGISKGVDAVTTASTSKWKSGSMVTGAYLSDQDEDYGAILGITYPVAITFEEYAEMLANLEELRESQKTVNIYNPNAGGATPRDNYVDALEDTYSYAMTDISADQPTAYKIASYANGEISFSAVKSGGADAPTYEIDPYGTGYVSGKTYMDEFVLKTGDESTYGDYELDFCDTSANSNNFPVSGGGYAGVTNTDGSEIGIPLTDGSRDFFQIYGMMVQTNTTNNDSDCGYFAMRHMENIWWGSRYGLEIAWSAGVQEYVHTSSLLDNTSYVNMQGETMQNIIFITDKGYYTMAWEEYFAKIPTDYTFEVADQDVGAGTSTTITATGLDGYVKDYSISGPGDCTFFVIDPDAGTISWPANADITLGTYTLTLTDSANAWTELTTTFNLYSSILPVVYSTTEGKLVPNSAEGFSDSDVTSYISAITSVTVDGTSYALSGRNPVTVINADGSVNTSASCFTPVKETADNADPVYVIEIVVPGYVNYEFNFTLSSTSSTSLLINLSDLNDDSTGDSAVTEDSPAAEDAAQEDSLLEEEDAEQEEPVPTEEGTETEQEDPVPEEETAQGNDADTDANADATQAKEPEETEETESAESL
ncbi:MAG: FMN-binding protein [Oscillospiraceae bacterium]|nr:FMN-binding protein [Oscillospiraceae bacterium]